MSSCLEFSSAYEKLNERLDEIRTHYLLFADCLPDTPANSSRLSLTARCGYLYLLSTAAIAASLQRGIVCVARDGSCLAPQRINGSQSRDVPFEKLYPVYDIICTYLYSI